MAERPGLPTRSDQHLSQKINQTGGAALQTGMPVFRPAPPAKVVVGTGQDGCRSNTFCEKQQNAAGKPSGDGSATSLNGSHRRNAKTTSEMQDTVPSKVITL